MNKTPVYAVLVVTVIIVGFMLLDPDYDDIKVSKCQTSNEVKQNCLKGSNDVQLCTNATSEWPDLYLKSFALMAEKLDTLRMIFFPTLVLAVAICLYDLGKSHPGEQLHMIAAKLDGNRLAHVFFATKVLLIASFGYCGSQASVLRCLYDDVLVQSEQGKAYFKHYESYSVLLQILCILHSVFIWFGYVLPSARLNKALHNEDPPDDSRTADRRAQSHSVPLQTLNGSALKMPGGGAF